MFFSKEAAPVINAAFFASAFIRAEDAVEDTEDLDVRLERLV